MDLVFFIEIVSSHPVLSVEKMCFSILFRFACKFRLEMTPINHMLVNYLRGRLMWKRLQPVWSGLEGTSGISWGGLLWRGLLWHRLIWGWLIWWLLRSRLIWRGLLWCRLVWWLLRRCIRRTSRGVVIVVIVIVILVCIGIPIVLGIFRVWHYRTFHFTIILQSSLTLVSFMYSANVGIALFSYSYQIYHRLFKLKVS